MQYATMHALTVIAAKKQYVISIS